MSGRLPGLKVVTCAYRRCAVRFAQRQTGQRFCCEAHRWKEHSALRGDWAKLGREVAERAAP